MGLGVGGLKLQRVRVEIPRGHILLPQPASMTELVDILYHIRTPAVWFSITATGPTLADTGVTLA